MPAGAHSKDHKDPNRVVAEGRLDSGTRTISGLRRGLLICGLLALAVAPAAHAANVEVVVTLKAPPLAEVFARHGTLAFSSFARPNRLLLDCSRRAGTTCAARHRPAGAAGSDPRRDSPGPRALAFWRRAQRLRRRRPALRARKALTRGGRPGLAEHRLPHTARQDTADHRRADRVGADAGDRRAGSEDRDRRRRNRPDASVLRAGRVRVSAGLSERSDRVHDAEGDRRAGVRSRDTGLCEREAAVRPRPLRSRHPRRRHRGGKQQHADANRRLPALRHRPPRLPRQLQSARHPE